MGIFKSKYKIQLLFLFLLAFLLGVAFDSQPVNDLYNRVIFKHFQNRIKVREQRMLQMMEVLKEKSLGADNGFHAFLNKKEKKRLHKDQISLLLYKNDSLNYWTDNMVTVNKPDQRIKPGKPLIFLGNGWYIIHDFSEDSVTVRGLELIRRQYQYENKYLKAHFFRGAWIDRKYTISTVPVEKGIPVKSLKGAYLFSLVYPDNIGEPIINKVLSFVFYFLGLIFVFLWLIRFFRKNPSRGRLVLFFLFFVFVFLIFVIVHWEIPHSIHSLSLFSPYYFALSDWIPSLGDLFICSVFVFFLFYLYWLVFPTEKIIASKKLFPAYLLAGFFFSGIFFSGVTELSYQLIMNSSLSFEPYKILNINIFSIVGIISVGLLFMAFILFTDRILLLVLSLSPGVILLFFTGSLLSFMVAEFLLGFHISYPVILTFILVVMALWLKQKSMYAGLIMVSVLTGLYATLFVVNQSYVKEKKNGKVLAVNLGAEHDPVAELMMGELSSSIKKDPELKFIMKKNSFNNRDVNNIFQYLTMRYFKGYWNKYDLSVYLCTPGTGLYVNEENEEPCFHFFQNLINTIGTPLWDTRFYYLDNQNGQISYFGAFYFPSRETGDSNGLFLQLDSRLLYEQLGYPELLLDKATSMELQSENYSYAKYYNGHLVAQNGKYQYGLTDKMFIHGGKAFSFVRLNGYNHLIYHENTPVSVVLSFPVRHFKDYLVSFSYFFIFFFLFFLITFSRSVFPVRIQFHTKLLKQKIQLWMVSLLLFTLLFIGSASVIYNIRQFQANHFKNLTEKILSVYVELEHKLTYEKKLDRNWSSPQYASLNDLLVKFSNVFYSDINLFDSNGLLLATSRPEIFEKKLTGERMNEEAYYQLSVLKQSEFVQKESLGNLRFLSAYMPFLNSEGHLLAYLNLPYFTKQYVLTHEVSNMIVWIINYMVVLILITIIIAVIISDKITNPLRIIQEKIGRFRLGKEYEHIVYKGNDEIGSLVDAYNRMIDELAKNVELLTKSERETAWREMAKQIAHEIKNPLTPMKLSVQQLRRSWEDKKEDFNIQLDKLTRTLIEQIDRLSYIASAFSNFARLPKMKNEPVQLIQLLKDTIILFRAQHEIVFDLQSSAREELRVFADKELLKSVFTNLLKNAVQSLSGRKNGKIEVFVRLLKEKHKVRVYVRDNGAGIPEGLEDKLFEPNFTTRSSGMGMGLAIVKKIVEDTGGSVRFEPNPGSGTTFIVELPLYYY